MDLPSVPLGIMSRGSFWVISNGYSSLELKHRVSPTVPIELEITYPDGPDVGLANERVRVVISAMSNTPVSWAGKIEFADPDGERFSVAISGCADNSIMTNYPFVKAFSGRFSFSSIDEQPIKFLNTSEVKLLATRESDFKDSMTEFLRNKELLEQELLLGNVEKKKGSKDENRRDSTQPTAPVRVPGFMGQSDPRFNPDYGSDDRDWKEKVGPYLHIEAVMLLKWLNRFVSRKPLASDHFPHCILEVRFHLSNSRFNPNPNPNPSIIIT
jgi:hypothetical protein